MVLALSTPVGIFVFVFVHTLHDCFRSKISKEAGDIHGLRDAHVALGFENNREQSNDSES